MTGTVFCQQAFPFVSRPRRQKLWRMGCSPPSSSFSSSHRHGPDGMCENTSDFVCLSAAPGDHLANLYLPQGPCTAHCVLTLTWPGRAVAVRTVTTRIGFCSPFAFGLSQACESGLRANPRTLTVSLTTYRRGKLFDYLGASGRGRVVRVVLRKTDMSQVKITRKRVSGQR